MKGNTEQKDVRKGGATPSPYPGIKSGKAGQSLGPSSSAPYTPTLLALKEGQGECNPLRGEV